MTNLYPITPAPSPTELASLLGDLDIYLFDQIVKGRLSPGDRVLDAGCGGGRNLIYLLRAGFAVWATDRSPAAVAETRAQAAVWAPHLPAEHFRVEPVEALSFPDSSFEVVLCSAVLHFADGEAHFRAMMREMARLLAPGGLFFARLGSTIGVESVVVPQGDRRFLQPEGSVRFLVDRDLLLEMTEALPGQLLEPIKTTVVDGMRAMTTWVVRKRG
jgi:tellurite methyltransferase